MPTISKLTLMCADVNAREVVTFRLPHRAFRHLLDSELCRRRHGATPGARQGEQSVAGSPN